MSTSLPGLPTLFTAEEVADMVGKDHKAFRAYLRDRAKRRAAKGLDRGHIAVTKTNLRLTQEDVDEVLAELRDEPRPATTTPTGLALDRERVLRQRAGRRDSAGQGAAGPGGAMRGSAGRGAARQGATPRGSKTAA